MALLLTHVTGAHASVVTGSALASVVAYHALSKPVRGNRRGPHHRRRVAAFDAAVAVIVLAELPPLGTYVDDRFSVHMVEHLLFCLVAAPLLVLARPGAVFARAFTAGAARSVVHRLSRPIGAALAHPAVAWLSFVGYLWLVHFSALYDLAADDPTIHLLEHVGFLVTAAMVWRPLLGPRSHLLPGPLPILYVMSLMPAMAFCGLVLFSADHLLYDAYAAEPSPLPDQRLGGAMMWVLPIVSLLPLLLVLVVRWSRREERAEALREAEARARRRRATPAQA